MEGGGGKGLASSYITSFSAKGAKCNLLRRNTPFSLVEEEKYRKMNGEKVKKWFFEVTQINNQKSLSLLFRYRRNRFIVEGELNPEIQLNQRTRFTKIRIAIQVSRDDPRVEEIHNEYDLDRIIPSLSNYSMDLPSYANKLAWIRTVIYLSAASFHPGPVLRG